MYYLKKYKINLNFLKDSLKDHIHEINMDHLIDQINMDEIIEINF